MAYQTGKRRIWRLCVQILMVAILCAAIALVDKWKALGVGLFITSLLIIREIGSRTTVVAIRRETLLSERQAMGRLIPTHRSLAAGVTLCEIRGPLFFGTTEYFKEVIESVGSAKVLILQMRDVEIVDTSAIHTLDELQAECKRSGALLLLVDLQPQPARELRRSGFLEKVGCRCVCSDIDDCFRRLRSLTEDAALDLDR